MSSGKRFGAALATAVATALLTFLLAAGELPTFGDVLRPRVIFPALASGLSAFLSFLQPSTFEGLRSDRARRAERRRRSR